MRRPSLLDEWIFCENFERQKIRTMVATIALICIFSVTASLRIRANEPKTYTEVTVENGHLYSPEGYDFYYTTVVAEPGDTIEGTAKALMEKFQMEDYCSLKQYELAFFHLNKGVTSPRRDFKSGYSYIWPYWIPSTD